MPKKPEPQSWLVTYAILHQDDPYTTFGSVLASKDPLSAQEIYGAVLKVIREGSGLGEDAPVCILNVMPCAWSVG